ncbi:response regulator [Halotia branconii]|uniref:Response regulator n=1 Tax=Halotia branconii CENA392 TaxID=1539056 RepID=A0AAJ6NVH2_9CYAN|nr:response regulator [Halotia branconii]WGV27490.1 response regulator [Halotia branconii CENA392]
MMDINEYSILLIEDDSNDILFVQRAFRQVNATNPIRIVKDGDAAIDYLAGEGKYADRDRYPLPALILLDLKLPRRSGIEILEWMRQQPGIKRIPVVILTSSRESLDIDLSYDLGVNSYLVKPVRFDALAKMIAALDSYWLQINEYPSVLPAG